MSEDPSDPLALALVDAWIWPDGWRLVRALDASSLLSLVHEAEERGILIGARPSLQSIKDRSIVSQDSSASKPYLFLRDPTDRVLSCLVLRHMGNTRIFLEDTLWAVVGEIGLRMASVVESLPRAARGDCSVSAGRQGWPSRSSYDEIVRSLSPDLDLLGAPSPAGEVALLLGVLPPEMGSSWADLVE